MTLNSDAKAPFLKMAPGAFLKAYAELKTEEEAKTASTKAGKVKLSIPRDDEFDEDSWLRRRQEKMERKRRIPR